MGSCGSFCGSLGRTQPGLTLLCVDRTFSTAGSAPAVDSAQWTVATLRPAPADVVEGAGHQVALTPSLRCEGCPRALLRLSCQFLGLMPEDGRVHLGFPAVSRARFSAA